ncbi:histidinol-phosphatase, inositol monophosphatase family [Cognatiyoonia koreensis]|uniref:Histidinol-phosphatase, inositol monophosphatase family n=1 Tax=Cognatiyoonia koreensis TaxID=364200 RepID=A0A1I0QC45_9RHOB|nr:inositol monophosphatase family protein [Cognatiyoonia koreensis]SEW24625.1 histidinol-phosphatase, inositol monophosphatase family [Cognatiyoonia koreensis]
MSPDSATKDDLIRVAHLLADAARTETLRLFRVPGLMADDKAGDGQLFDPVTEADRAAEAAMRRVLETERPDDGILGEEFGTKPGSSGLTWVLDPIDGTRGYISGTPTWGVLISVADQTGPLFGIIDQPYIQERFEGGFGRATMTGPQGTQPLAARRKVGFAQATLLTTFPEVGTNLERRAFEKIASGVKLTRYGLDCYAYALLAAGQVDLVIEAGLQPYDIHAPICVIEAAGGIVSNWQGGAAHHGGRVIAAANPDIHAVALSILQETVDG